MSWNSPSVFEIDSVPAKCWDDLYSACDSKAFTKWNNQPESKIILGIISKISADLHKNIVRNIHWLCPTQYNKSRHVTKNNNGNKESKWKKELMRARAHTRTHNTSTHTCRMAPFVKFISLSHDCELWMWAIFSRYGAFGGRKGPVICLTLPDCCQHREHQNEQQPSIP